MSEAFINVRNTPKRVAFCKNLDLLFSVGYFVFRGTFFFFPHLDSPLLSSLLLSDCFKEQVSTTPWGPVIESAEGRTECRNLIKNATENTYIIQIYILMPLLCQHKNCPEMSCYLRISQVMLSKSAGEEKKRRKKESCIKPYVKFINFRGDKNQRDWSGRGLASFLFDQRRHDTLLTSSPCYGRREKSALLRFKGFHLYRVGVTTSNILEILTQKACAILPSTGRLPDVRAPSD